MFRVAAQGASGDGVAALLHTLLSESHPGPYSKLSKRMRFLPKTPRRTCGAQALGLVFAAAKRVAGISVGEWHIAINLSQLMRLGASRKTISYFLKKYKCLLHTRNMPCTSNSSCSVALAVVLCIVETPDTTAQDYAGFGCSVKLDFHYDGCNTL